MFPTAKEWFGSISSVLPEGSWTSTEPDPVTRIFPSRRISPGLADLRFPSVSLMYASPVTEIILRISLP